ncbi:MAG TPA: MarR family transcriptional regulator [Polyangia bacterium]|jgi:Transcriptional regulators|nr:MarR family transcriptional regulator [Polyangia bacterium]
MLAKQVPVGLLMALVRRRQRQAVEIRVRDLGLSNQQFWLLVALLERQGASLAEILAALPMDQPTASRVLAALSRRKLVRLDSDPADRRRRRMVLTPRGEQFGARCLVVAAQVRQAAEAHFSSDEMATLRGWLRRIVDNLDELDRLSPPGPGSLANGLAARPARDK